MRVTPIYHITHLRNLGSIIELGGLFCDNERMKQAISCVDIGHRDLKNWRASKPVPIRPQHTLGDYVPHYFAPRSPMLYVISKGGVEQYQEGQREIVHLVSSVEQVVAAGLPFIFTEGHPRVEFSRYFDDPSDLKEIDWAIMQARYWADTLADPDRSRRRQAEFLVRGRFPWELVSQIGVMTERTAQTVRGILASASHRPPVTIEPSWYY
jgi:hypothetical protein